MHACTYTLERNSVVCEPNLIVYEGGQNWPKKLLNVYVNSWCGSIRDHHPFKSKPHFD